MPRLSPRCFPADSRFVFSLGNGLPCGSPSADMTEKLMGRILFLGVSPFLILATDSVIQIVMNTSLQTFGVPPREIC